MVCHGVRTLGYEVTKVRLRFFFAKYYFFSKNISNSDRGQNFGPKNDLREPFWCDFGSGCRDIGRHGSWENRIYWRGGWPCGKYMPRVVQVKNNFSHTQTIDSHIFKKKWKFRLAPQRRHLVVLLSRKHGGWSGPTNEAVLRKPEGGGRV